MGNGKDRGETRDQLIESAAPAIVDYLEVMHDQGLAPGKAGEHIANVVVRV